MGDSDTDFLAGTDGYTGGASYFVEYHHGSTRVTKLITAGQLKALREADTEAGFNAILDAACGTNWISALPSPSAWRTNGWESWLPAEKNALP